MKILLTGTHFTPAQAVIEELQKSSNVEIIYIGRKYTREGDKSLSVESQVLPKIGVKFLSLAAGRVQRIFTPYTIPSLLKIPIGFLQAFYLLLQEKPDVVLSFGGYVGVPVVFSAWLLSIPIMIHEQTLVSGLANRFSAHFADKIALTLKENNLSLYGKTVITGNPLRKELTEKNPKIHRAYKEILMDAKKNKLPIVYITGGNQGSHAINEAVKEILSDLIQNTYVIHQCGDSKFNDFESLLQTSKQLNYPERYLVSKWINSLEVGQILKSADLVISRAGMNTLLEASFFAKPILILPLPLKEQLLNARYFEKLGNAIVLNSNELNGENFLKFINKGLNNLKKLEEKALDAKKIVIPNGAKRLALETLILANSRK